jgi:NAD(P)-dependent dehydrogenase (short-subunit alcohol dehydrogenase family)
VIGSSSGIGLAVAQRLAAAGWNVTGMARRPAGFSAERYEHVIADVRDPDFPALLAEAFDAGGGADAVIYCAGVGRFVELDSMEGEADVVVTNLVGAVATAEVVIPRMLAAGRGHLVGLSSLSDMVIDPHAPSYSASKAGMSSYLEALGLACRSRGVHVTNVRLGFVDTEMSRETSPRPFLASPERIARLVEKCLRTRPLRTTYPWRMVPLLWFFMLPRRIRLWLT